MFIENHEKIPTKYTETKSSNTRRYYKTDVILSYHDSLFTGVLEVSRKLRAK